MKTNIINNNIQKTSNIDNLNDSKNKSVSIVKISEKAKQLLNMYASFDEISEEQFIEDGLNVANEFKEKAIKIINIVNQITNAYADMDNNLDEDVANILNDIVNI